ncbi:MAG: hypothetical protein ACRBI6_15315 [Acidimicrobiales bacterium]
MKGPRVPPQLRPGAPAPTVVTGSRCETSSSHGEAEAHVGCPGWWSGFDGSAAAGAVCSCSCHAFSAGWPGWEAHPDFVTESGAA